jgi:hypothetical protein
MSKNDNMLILLHFKNQNGILCDGSRKIHATFLKKIMIQIFNLFKKNFFTLDVYFFSTKLLLFCDRTGVTEMVVVDQ